LSDRHGNLQKYQNPNPIQRYLIRHFLTQVGDLVADLAFATVLDAGCAEGFVSRHLAAMKGERFASVGIDIDDVALRRGTQVFPAMQRTVGSVLSLPFPDACFDLVLCTEVLEHLSSPDVALRELCRVTGHYCLLSVPHEPWFRTLNFLRGKHWCSWGNDPEHLQNWTGRQFAALVSQEFEVVVSTSAFPWWIVLGRKRGG